MKNILSVFTLLASFISVAHADIPPSPLLTVVNPASGMMVDPVSSKIEILGNGDVMVTKTEGKRGTTETIITRSKIFEITKVQEINQCVAEIEKVGVFVPNEVTCQDDPGTQYYSHQKQIANRVCGKTQYLAVPCVPSMLRLLNAFNTISRY